MAWISYSTLTQDLVQISDFELIATDGLTITSHPLSKLALEIMLAQLK